MRASHGSRSGKRKLAGLRFPSDISKITHNIASKAPMKNNWNVVKTLVVLKTMSFPDL